MRKDEREKKKRERKKKKKQKTKGKGKKEKKNERTINRQMYCEKLFVSVSEQNQLGKTTSYDELKSVARGSFNSYVVVVTIELVKVVESRLRKRP